MDGSQTQPLAVCPGDGRARLGSGLHSGRATEMTLPEATHRLRHGERSAPANQDPGVSSASGPLRGRRMFIPTFDRSSQCREERKAVFSQLVSAFRVLCRANLPLQNALVGTYLLIDLFPQPWPWPTRRSQRDMKQPMTGDTSRCFGWRPAILARWQHVNNCRPGCDPSLPLVAIQLAW